MKISTIKLRNFKFHNKTEIILDTKNLLVYGENGSGKSSLFLALESLYSIYFDNNLINESEYKSYSNRNTNKQAVWQVSHAQNKVTIARNKIYTSNINYLSKQTSHFLNHEFLNLILNETHTNDFYAFIEKYLYKNFYIFDHLYETLESITSITETNAGLLTQKLNDTLDKSLKKVEKLANVNLYKYFKENLEIKFEVEDKFRVDFDNQANMFLHKPKIIIRINSLKNIKNNYNEARVKIISIALYFALIRLNDMKSTNNTFKLLLLDDILLSLDMSNRNTILDYIFEKFHSYQILIFTHDIFFYELVRRKINHLNKSNNWLLKNIFAREVHGGFSEPIIFAREDDYLSEAEKFLQENKLEQCGNNIRKELEKIFSIASMDFVIGRKEELQTLMNNFQNADTKRYYKNSNQILNKIYFHLNTMNKILMNTYMLNDKKIDLINSNLQKIISLFNTNPFIDASVLKALIKNVEWYKNIVGNAGSHHNLINFYKREFQNGLTEVKKIKKIFIEFEKQ